MFRAPGNAWFPLIKLAKKLKEKSLLLVGKLQKQFPLIKLAKKLKDMAVSSDRKEIEVSIN